MNRLLHWGLLASVALVSIARAEDLDVPAAKAKYDAQRLVADAAKARFDSAERVLRDAESRLQTAEYQEAQAVAARDQAEQRLHDLNSEINSLNSLILTKESYVASYQRQLADVDSQLVTKRRERDHLTQHIQQLDHEIQHLAQQIAQLEAKPDAATNPEIPRLRQEKQHAEQHRADEQYRLNDCNNQIYSLESERNRIVSALHNEETELQNMKYRLANTINDRDRQIRVIDNANDEVRRARARTDSARNEVAAARPPYYQAKSEYEFQETLAQAAYDYWQKVAAAYQAALNAVYAKADAAAAVDGGKEAADRAPAPGAADGDRVGRSDGSTKGTADGAQRDFFKGYLDGRKVGATDPALSTPYKDGTAQGQLAARNKAHAEEYPKGYNEALRLHLASPPAGSATVDISQSIGSDPGGSGQMLKLTNQSIGSVADPSVTEPKEPVYAAPTAGTPGVSVPSSLKAYFSPPCAGLVLAEFEPLCRARYENSYLWEFDAQYKRIYRQEYGRTYAVASPAAYQAALAVNQAAPLAQGRVTGAKDQGLLDGFAGSLAALKIEETGFGKKAFTAYLKTGGFLVVRAATLEETSGDGLFTPGEPAKLTLVLDNYGLESTALGKIRVKATPSGLGAPNFTIRELPALAANSRTTLTGVVAAPIVTEAPGDKLKLDLTFEVDTGNGFKPFVNAKAEAETGFPLELTDITLPKNPKVNEKVEAKFKFKNRTKADLSNVKGDLDSNPQFVLFTKNQVDLPPIAAGAEVELPVEIAPGPWVGDNTYVNFTSALTFGDGRKVKQALHKFLTLDRSAVLLLFDQSGQAVPSSTLRVKAGSRVFFYVQLKYKATKYLPGPFIVRASKTSNPGVSPGNGSTTSVNYGSLSPGTTLSKISMNYTVPAASAGKSEYIMVQVDEGWKTQHALMIYLDVY